MRQPRKITTPFLLILAFALAAAACTEPARSSARSTASAPPSQSTSAVRVAPLPGMPPPLDPRDVYAGDRPGLLSPTVRHDRFLVYVPNFGSGTVSVIDPRRDRVIQTVRVGAGPQHVVPSWDLKTLWVNNNSGNSLTPIDPVTGRFGRPVAVDDPYNLYFTPDGRFAVVMAETRRQIVFRDPHTMAVKHVLPVGCAGVNHADFSPDGRYFIVTCEFSGDLIKVDTAAQRIVGRLHLPGKAMPQDIKISPDGRTWYVADMQTSGVWLLNGDTLTVSAFLPTGQGAHGLYPSRDSSYLYVTNRGEGSISLISFATRRIVRKWILPGHASPDMGGVSADGRVLWLSGRYDGEVYAINTTTGHLIARIPVGVQPHGLCVWPQPGRYSLGHTGILR
jgi:YVTN family beta-propeller protein